MLLFTDVIHTIQYPSKLSAPTEQPDHPASLAKLHACYWKFEFLKQKESSKSDQTKNGVLL